MSSLPYIGELENCPYCASEGYYYIARATGTVTTWVNFDGSEADNSEMYNGLGTEPKRYAYCAECHKKIGRMQREVEL